MKIPLHSSIFQVETLLTEMGYYPRGQLKPSEFDVPLDCFMGDHTLPGYIHVLPSDVKEFLSSHLITSHMLVLQVHREVLSLLLKFKPHSSRNGKVSTTPPPKNGRGLLPYQNSLFIDHLKFRY